MAWCRQAIAWANVDPNVVIPCVETMLIYPHWCPIKREFSKCAHFPQKKFSKCAHFPQKYPGYYDWDVSVILFKVWVDSISSCLISIYPTSYFQSSTNSAPVAPPRSKTKKAAPKATLDDFDDIDDLDDDFEPVAVDLNMVDNLLQSYNAQQGMPGPTSNMLGSMGIRMHSSKKSWEPTNSSGSSAN